MKPEQLKYSILKKAFSGQLVMVDSDSEKPKVKAVELEETPFDIPNDWFWSNLGNCCEMYTGNSISESVKKAKYTGLKEGFDYIATKDVSFEHTIEYDNGVRIPVDDNFRRAYSGSVLMCIEGGSAGRKIGILDRDVCFGNKLCTFNSQEIINSYIYYYLQSHEFKAFFMDNMSGIIGGVSIKKLKGLPIPVPTVSEQKAIVAKIEELLPYVDRYAEAYEKLEQFNAKFPEDMKKSILQYAIQGKLVEQRPEEGTAEELYQQIQENQPQLKDSKSDLVFDAMDFDIPETWKWVEVNQIFNFVDYRGKTPNKIAEGVFLVTASNIRQGYMDYTRKEHISRDEYETRKSRGITEKGDLLFTTEAPMGNAAICDLEECSCGQRVITFKEYTDGTVYSKLFMYFILSPAFQKQLVDNCTGTTAKGIKADKLKHLLLPLPPISEQYRIVEKIDELLPFCNRLSEGR